jgi:hypothetical protein
MRPQHLVNVVALVVLSAGCASAAASTTAKPSIRGSWLFGFSCHARGVQPRDGLPTGRVLDFRLCPLEVPNGTSGVVTVAKSNSDFVALRRALTAPDEPPVKNQACAMYADLPQRVLAKTTTGVLLVHIPVDSCGHYQPAATAALAAARAG